MRYGIADLRILSMIGLIITIGPAWGQAPGPTDARRPPSISAPTTPMPVSMQGAEADIGDRSGGPASCRPRYSTEATQIGLATGDQEKDDYGFTLIGTDCPAPL